MDAFEKRKFRKIWCDLIIFSMLKTSHVVKKHDMKEDTKYFAHWLDTKRQIETCGSLNHSKVNNMVAYVLHIFLQFYFASLFITFNEHNIFKYMQELKIKTKERKKEEIEQVTFSKQFISLNWCANLAQK